MDSVLLIALIAVMVLVAGGAIVWWLWRPGRRATGESAGPPMVFLPTEPAQGESAASVRPLRTVEPVHLRAVSPSAPLRAVEEEPYARAVGDEHDHALPRDGSAALGSRRRRERIPVRESAHGETVAARTVLTGTLRMLPGRLEVLAGMPAQSEIRFVQTGGGPQQRVTIGRQDGPPYEHVQLPSQTVSRLHAALVFAQGRWSVSNLSETNPLRLNGEPMPCGTPPVQLADGDTLELGEVVLRFHG